MGDDVQVRFGAQIEGVTAGINQVKQQIEELKSPLSGVADASKDLAEAIGAAFAVEKIAEFLDRFGELGEQIDRTAKITGIATDGVQQFKLAIQLAGGDADNAAQTLKILEKNIGDAESGSGKAYEAFANLGVSLDDLKTKSPIDILAQMKDRMDEAGDSAGQSAIKVEYMRAVAGRAGADFLALDGSLEKVKKVAEETGYVMSPKMVGQAKELADSTHTLGAAWTGLSNTIASDVEPVYRRLIDLTTGVVEGTNRLLGGVQQVQEQAKSGVHFSDNAFTNGFKQYDHSFGPTKPTNPLPPLAPDGGAAKGEEAAEREEISIERNDLQTSLEINKLKLQAKKDADAQSVASGKMSKVQELTDLISFTQQEKQYSLSALNDEMKLWDEDSAEYHALLNRKLVITQQYDNQIAKLNAQSLAEQRKQYDQFFQSINSAFKGSIQGILQGTQTWQQATANIFTSILASFAGMLEEMAMKWLENQILDMVIGKTEAESTIAAHAAEAGAAAYASTAAIPIVGPELAPAAAEAAYAGAMSFAGLTSLDVGAWNIPNDGPAYLHKGEMVVPRTFAEDMRDGGGLGAGGGGGNYTININAIDTQTGAQFLKQHAGVIVAAISGQARNFNRNMPAWKP